MRPRWSTATLGASALLATSFGWVMAQGNQPPIILSEMNNIFAFGDSYTATGYNPLNGLTLNLTTLGNSSANGFNWLQYLALRNPSTVSSYFDLAAFGATVNGSVVEDRNQSIPDGVSQVATFRQYFVPAPTEVPWKSNDTLFALWFGINDIGFSLINNVSFPLLFPSIGASYNNLISSLYSSGARNFLILNVPPTDRSPLITDLGASAVQQVGTHIALYNALLAQYPAAFNAAYPAAKLVMVDTQVVFNEILDNPLSYGFTSTTSTCSAYERVRNDPLVDLPSQCPWPFWQYFWADGYHPTWRVHEILGEAVTKRLTAGVAPANLTSLPRSTAVFTSPRSITSPSSSTSASSSGTITSRPSTATLITSATSSSTSTRDMQSVISVIVGGGGGGGGGPRPTSGGSALLRRGGGREGVRWAGVMMVWVVGGWLM